MKSLITSLVIVLSSLTALAQDHEIARYEAKIQKPFVSAVNWERDFSEAKKKATKSKAIIFGYFTRSYSP